MTSSQHIQLISSFPQKQSLGIGRTGLVIRQGQIVVKLSLRWSRSSEEAEANIESLQYEQAIYQRLGRYDGIVPCLSFSETATQLHIMKNGGLHSYLCRNKPSKSLNFLGYSIQTDIGRLAVLMY
ncbi:hypothetical protein BO78DRAFT_148819 [Aspergillus sclerotiicarbonarius CBS 121057]|uniref:Protein kinase domain-containing protein n=1 Tax=Aspergillus sclerotiicarbonarius (strain CBS 121057 / IBT 28362) TaxID=1448318 RepID=A0A319FFG4_ASPSB|nr:hypothetical protein BO78DRAFT_148819 [Aspergillus sclerotiicarbonarius CBS 121057]